MPARLILVEEGASGFEPAPSMADGAPEIIMVVQTRGEAKPDFADRALRRIAALERTDRVITEALIAAAPDQGSVFSSARVAAARAVMAHMARAGGGEIALVAAQSDGHELRHELLALAGLLTAQEDTGSVCVRVLFEAVRKPEPERKSGVHVILLPETDEFDDADSVQAAS